LGQGARVEGMQLTFYRCQEWRVGTGSLPLPLFLANSAAHQYGSYPGISLRSGQRSSSLFSQTVLMLLNTVALK